MPKKITLLIAAIVTVLIFAASVSAEGYSYGGAAMTFPDEFTLLKRNNLTKNGETVEMLGYTASALKKQMENDGIYVVAVSDDNKEQFVYKFTTTDFSERTGSFNDFDDEALARINREMFGGNARVCTVGGLVWFRTKTHTEPSEFYTFQYVTVQNGSVYSFVYYGKSSAPMEQFMKTVTVKTDKTTMGFANILLLILLILLSLVALAALVFLAVSILRDLKLRSENAYTEEPDRIRRRP